MPRLPFTHNPIKVAVCDLVMEDTILKQEAEFVGINIEVVGGQTQVTLNTCASFFSIKDGAQGAPVLPGCGPIPRKVELYANNQCAAYFNPSWEATEAQPQDPRNGEVIYYRSILAENVWQKKDAAGHVLPELYDLDDQASVPEPVLPQGDLFEGMMDQPIIMRQLIEQNMRQADQPPFNRYKFPL